MDKNTVIVNKKAIAAIGTFALVAAILGAGVFFVHKNNGTQQESIVRVTRADDGLMKVTAKGVIPDGYNVSLKDATEDTKALKKASKKLSKGSQVIASYDISIADENGNEYQPKDNKRSVTLLVESDSFKQYDEIEVYHIPDNGKAEKMDVLRVRDDAVVIETDGFSTYVFGGQTIITQNAKTAAYLKDGRNFNDLVKKLETASNKIYIPVDGIKAIKWTSEPFTSSVELQEEGEPIYGRYDSSTQTIYLYTAADKVYLNKDCSYMFYYMSGATEINLIYDDKYNNKLDTSLVTDTSFMFNKCYNLETLGKNDKGIEIGTAYWDMSEVTTLEAMFEDCYYILFDCSYWDTKNVTTAKNFAKNCQSLFGIDISGWDTSNLTDVSHMFDGCINLIELVLSEKAGATKGSFVTDYSYFLNSCNKLDKIDMSDWDISAGVSFTGMFNCQNLTEVVSPKKISTPVNVPYYKWMIDDNGDGESDDGGDYYFFEVATTSHVYKIYEYVDTVLMDGSNLNVAFKKLSGQTGSINRGTANTSITAIEWTEENLKNATGTIRIDVKGAPVYAKYYSDSGTIKLYTQPSVKDVYLNSDSAAMFWGFKALPKVEFLEDERINTSNVTSFYLMFYYSGLKTLDATGWDTSNVSNFGGVFYNSSLESIEGISDWDVSKGEDFGNMFTYCGNLKKLDLSKWKTSSANNMAQMFFSCGVETVGDLSEWDTSNVKSFVRMFWNCRNLTAVGDLSGWDVSNATEFISMFDGCVKIKSVGSLSGWNTSKATNMQSMFSGCTSLESLDLSGWDTSSVTSVQTMFNNCQNLTTVGNLSGWNTLKATSFYSMFYNCANLKTLDLSGWDTSSVNNITYMFSGCVSLTSVGDLSSWDLSNVSSLAYLFNGCVGLESIEVSKWDTSNVTAFSYAFKDCMSLELLDISEWVVNENSVVSNFMIGCDGLKVIKAPKKVGAEIAITLPIADNVGWYRDVNNNMTIDDDEYILRTQLDSNVNDKRVYIKTGRVTVDGYYGYSVLLPGQYFCAKIPSVYRIEWTDADLSKDKNAVRLDCDGDPIYAKFQSYVMYVYAPPYVEKVYLNEDSSGFLSNHGLMNSIPFLEDERIDTSKVTTFANAFYNCSYTAIDTSKWDMSNVKEYSYMFQNCDDLTSIDTTGWVTQNTRNIEGMFQNCKKIETIKGLSTWDTSNITNIKSAFDHCHSLTNLSDISNWDTSKMSNTSYAFRSCEAVEELDLSAWDVSCSTNLTEIFIGCKALKTLNLSGWDIAKVTSMERMFANCESLAALDVTGWKNTSHSVGAHSVFSGCSSLTYLDISSWDTYNWQINFFLDNCKSLVKIKSPRHVGGWQAGFPAGSWGIDDDEDGNFDTLEKYSRWILYADVSHTYIKGELHIVRFVVINGTETPPDQVFLASDDSAKVVEPVYRKIGYVFNGWYTDEGCTKKYDSSQIVTSDFTLYAKWIRPVYIITFDSDGGILVGQSTKRVAYGSIYGSLPSAQKENMYFGGWTTPTGELINSKNIVLLSENTTLTARWTLEEIKFTVTFETNGGSYIPPQEIPYGDTIVEPKTIRSGYTFDKWYTDEEFTIPWDFDTDTVDCDVTLYAGWIRNAINVTFNTNGGKFSDNTTTKIREIAAGTAVSAPEIPTKPKYSFVGWSEDGSALYDMAVPPENDLALYAVWEKSLFTVTLDANGGRFTDNEEIHKVEVNKLEAIGSAETPTRAGFTFKEWYCEGESWDSGQAVDGDKYVIAIWKLLEDSDSDKLIIKYKEHEWESKKTP